MSGSGLARCLVPNPGAALARRLVLRLGLARRLVPALAFGLARRLALALAFGLVAAAQAAVDANTATTVELEAITGIGPALAARIVEERRKSPFRSLDELRSRVRGVGEANLRKMRDSGLTVGAGSGAAGAETIVGGVGRASPAETPRGGGIRHELR